MFDVFWSNRSLSIDSQVLPSIILSPRRLTLFFGAGQHETNRMPSTQIILTENIPGLGAEADVVKVRRGFARNFLLPQGKALEVTKASMRKIDMLKGKRAEREAKEMNEAEEIARRIGKSKMVFTLETGETGKAFGSVTANDIGMRLKNEIGARDRSPSHCPRTSDQDDGRTRSFHQTAPGRRGDVEIPGQVGERAEAGSRRSRRSRCEIPISQKTRHQINAERFSRRRADRS